eukprot:TRINITY_DN4259_c0_g1_i1.p1 TRINITY_DN4259_c0_g1~~TRINITY_DN4259_c0_g1_i1.p1  ORF type:complete len:180 (-),score=68.62 TRINITY_DN4259_c0_g1_i1:188-727(-)
MEKLKKGEAYVSFHDFGIGDKEIKMISQELKKDNKVKELGIGGHNMTKEGWKEFVEAIKMNTSLQRLNLGYCGIDDEIASWFGQLLKVNSTLESLTLYGNEIGNDGAVALADGLKFNGSLDLLSLEGNQIMEEGKKALEPFLGEDCMANRFIADHVVERVEEEVGEKKNGLFSFLRKKE